MDPASSILAAVPASPTPSPAPDIRDIVAPQPFYLTGNYWLLLLAAGCVAAALAVAWFLFKNLRKPKVFIPPSPHEIARGRLTALQARVDQTEPRAFGEEVADILRAFIGAQYGLRAQRQTSPEFLDSVRGSTLFSIPQHHVLADFLNQCDLLKFARQDATRDGKLKLLDQATIFLDTDPIPLPAPADGSVPNSNRVDVAHAVVPPPASAENARYPYESPESRYMPKDPGPEPAELESQTRA